MIMVGIRQNGQGGRAYDGDIWDGVGYRNPVSRGITWLNVKKSEARIGRVTHDIGYDYGRSPFPLVSERRREATN
jgi:hypothetical protein